MDGGGVTWFLADIGDFSGEMTVISASFCRPTHSDLDGGLIDSKMIRRRNVEML